MKRLAANMSYADSYPAAKNEAFLNAVKERKDNYNQAREDKIILTYIKAQAISRGNNSKQTILSKENAVLNQLLLLEKDGDLPDLFHNSVVLFSEIVLVGQVLY